MSNLRLRHFGIALLLCAIVITLAITPLWFPFCPETQLTASEKVYFQSRTSFQYSDTYLSQTIPCGAEAFSPADKLYAARHRDHILDEVDHVLLFPVLRLELHPTPEPRKPVGLLHFRAYTFFNIPLFQARAGGSGYMEIEPIGSSYP